MNFFVVRVYCLNLQEIPVQRFKLSSVEIASGVTKQLNETEMKMLRRI